MLTITKKGKNMLAVAGISLMAFFSVLAVLIAKISGRFNDAEERHEQSYVSQRSQT